MTKDSDRKMADQVSGLLGRARVAQRQVEGHSQQQIDELVTAIAWCCTRPETVNRLALLATEQTRLGNSADKATKIIRKTIGTMADLKHAPSVGVIDVDDSRGVTTIAKPMGVIAAVLPSTNPAATPINNIMITLKSANAVVLVAHPRGEAVCAEVADIARSELSLLGAPRDLVQHLSLSGLDKQAGRDATRALMEGANYSLVTAGPVSVDLGLRSGTPSHGVGLGNVPVIVDDCADLADAVAKIVASKTFDYATSCSSENSLIVADSVYDEVIRLLQDHGGALLDKQEKDELQSTMWPDGGGLNRDVVAQSASRILELANIDRFDSAPPQFLIVEESGIGPSFPFSGEKLSVVLAVFRSRSFGESLATVDSILAYMGQGHSCGIHSNDEAHIAALAKRARVARVLVNQPHSLNNGGAFDNGLDFTLSMGAGTWGGNDTCENLTYRHFLNYTHLVRPVPEVVPTEEELFGDLLHDHAHRLSR